MVRNQLLRGAVIISVVLGGLLVSPVSADAATSSLSGPSISQPGRTRLIAGDLTTVSGSASADMVGRTVGLQLRVSGQWTTVAQTTVKPNRSYSVSVRLAGPGQITYRVAAWTGSRWLQREKALTSWKWFPLVDQQVVDTGPREGIFFSPLTLSPRPGIEVAGRTFGTQLAHEFRGSDRGYSEFNLGYKCSEFSTSIGLVDSSSSGSSVIFDVAIDGNAVSGIRRSVALGRLETLSIAVTGGFRLRLANERSSGSRGYPAWPNAKILCTAKP